MKRIYYHYKRWEDYRDGFYDNCSGEVKKEKITKVVELFSSPELTKEYMLMVLDKWIFSCEHNFTNPSLNRIAYLGQGACCLYAGVPSTITMEGWSLVEKHHQETANRIAIETIKEWELKNKRIQLCLNLD
jgi:hypothetical protein